MLSFSTKKTLVITYPNISIWLRLGTFYLFPSFRNTIDNRMRYRCLAVCTCKTKWKLYILNLWFDSAILFKLNFCCQDTNKIRDFYPPRFYLLHFINCAYIHAFSRSLSIVFLSSTVILCTAIAIALGSPNTIHTFFALVIPV